MHRNELGLLRTEQVNAKYEMLDAMTVSELLQAMNENDAEVPKAVAAVLPTIEDAIEGVVDRMIRGGRLIYIGAGTSGRLGVLDAAECGPTFSVGDDEVIAFIAGGEKALRKPAEGAEDDPQLAVADLKSISVGARFHISNNRTCEMAMSAAVGSQYVSALQLLHQQSEGESNR